MGLGKGGILFRATPRTVEAGEPFRNQRINKCADMIAHVFYVFYALYALYALRHFVSMSTDLLKKSIEESIERVLSIEELPNIDPCGVQAIRTARLGIKENGPVVKLLPEHHRRVGYGLYFVLHCSTASLSGRRSPHGPDLLEDAHGKVQAVCRDTNSLP